LPARLFRTLQLFFVKQIFASPESPVVAFFLLAQSFTHPTPSVHTTTAMEPPSTDTALDCKSLSSGFRSTYTPLPPPTTTAEPPLPFGNFLLFPSPLLNPYFRRRSADVRDFSVSPHSGHIFGAGSLAFVSLWSRCGFYKVMPPHKVRESWRYQFPNGCFSIGQRRPWRSSYLTGKFRILSSIATRSTFA